MTASLKSSILLLTRKIVNRMIEQKTFNGNDVIELIFSGRVDVANREQVRAALHQAIADAGKAVLVNLTQVPLIDSSGLSALVSGLRVAREQQKDLVLTGLNKQAQMVFSLTMMDKVFQVFPSAADALMYFGVSFDGAE